MPNSSIPAKKDKKPIQTSHKKTTNANQHEATNNKNFLTIGPALPTKTKKINKRPHSTYTSNTKSSENVSDTEPITLQSRPDGTTVVLRSCKEKEKNPDRINLDRRGLTELPFIEGEPKLRLLSLQHNLICNIDSLKDQKLPFLVFLDFYDNQLERISCLDSLENLRVLLLGKNRIKKIEGLNTLRKVEVLDLHGNQIMHVTGLSMLNELKVLNLAGNQIRQINNSDLQGLKALQELNLRRNHIRKLQCFAETQSLQKLFLSNNEIQKVEDMNSIAKSANLREISIDNNPVSLNGDCISFLVSYLPNLTNLNNMQVTEQVRKAAMAWRRAKESCNAAYVNLTSDVSLNAHREEIISNARTNWELLRSQTKYLNLKTSGPVPDAELKPDCDFILTSLSKHIRISRKKPMGKVFAGKKKMVARSSSQDTENSQHTSSSNASSNEYFRLPPILVPIIKKIERKNSSESDDRKLCSSMSSLGANVDSSVSSLSSSDDSSDTESIESEKNFVEKKICETELIEKPEETDDSKSAPLAVTKNTPTSSGNAETSSNISASTSVSNVTLPSTTVDDLQAGNPTKPKSKIRNIKSAAYSKVTHSKINTLRPVTAKTKKLISPVVNRDREQGGDYLIEICGRHLNIYGQGAVRFIDKPWNQAKANDVNTVNFNYTNFNGVTGYWCKLKQRFPNADHFIFKETNIQYLGQLNALAEVQGLTSLFIDPEGNPITEKNWESYAIYRLSHWGLKIINGREISEDDVKAANEEYKSLSELVLSSLPDVYLQPLLMRLQIDVGESDNPQKAKQWLKSADPALKSVVCKEALQWKKGPIGQDDLALRQRAKLHMGAMLDDLCNAVVKLRLLDEQWSEILQETIRNTLLDYSQLDRYMKEKLEELK